MHRLCGDRATPNLRVTKLEGDISNTPQTVATGSATLLVGNKSEDAKFVLC
ncbi:LppX_LprAFG lipoprotein [Mycobacterium tuberculosis]